MPDDKGNGKITEEQANEALRQLLNQNGDEESETPSTPEPAPDQPAAEPAVETASATETPAQEAAPETQPVPSPESDDVTSLKERLTKLESEREAVTKKYEARWKAIQDRNAANERILRDRFLRKSSVADRALKILKATRTEQGVPEADVDRTIREIESTMNPDSPSYAPPEPHAEVAEDRRSALNRFLNEKGMDAEEEAEFGKWLQTEAVTALSPGEQDIARESVNGFLHLAHNRWQEGLRVKDKQTKRSDVVEAVRSVQRVQKAAVRAASPSDTAPKKQPTAARGTTPDWRKMSESERNEWVSSLLKDSVEQYR